MFRRLGTGAPNSTHPGCFTTGALNRE